LHPSSFSIGALHVGQGRIFADRAHSKNY